MSKLRSVSTGTWSDPWYEELKPHQKLIFLYLITNEKTNMLGIYEASVKKISFETGVNKDDITKCLNQFEIDGKIKYQNNFIILVNFLKHQNFNTNMKKGAIKVYDSLPKDLKVNGLTLDDSNPIESFESLSNHYGTVSKRESNINPKPKEKENNKIEEQRLLKIAEIDFKNNQFEIFWTLYEKKDGKKKCLDKFLTLKNEDILKIIEVTPKYVKSTPNVQYRKNPLTWLNGEHWNDEIILNLNNGKSTVNNSKPTTAEVYQLDYEQNADRDREILLAQLKQRKIEREQSGN